MYIDEHISSLEQALFLLDATAANHQIAMGLAPDTNPAITMAMGQALFDAPQLGQEGVGSFLTGLWDAFLNLIRLVGERLKDFWDALWDNSKKTQRAAESTGRKVKKAVESGAQVKSQASDRVKNATLVQAESKKVINKVESINDAMADALNKGAFHEALKILEDIAHSSDVDDSLRKVAKLIGDFSENLVDTFEIQSAPIATVRNDDVSGGKIERRILGKVGDKAAFIDITYDRQKHAVKSILGVTELTDKDLQQMNIRNYSTQDNKHYIPGTELVNIVNETQSILEDIERARGSKARARKGTSSELYGRVKRLRSALADIDVRSQGGKNETEVTVTTDQARQIVEWGKIINEMCNKAEFCQGKVSAAMDADIRKLIIEINGIEFE